MSATCRTQIKQSQSPTWEEIESLLARELKIAYGGRPRRQEAHSQRSCEISEAVTASAGHEDGGNEHG